MPRADELTDVPTLQQVVRMQEQEIARLTQRIADLAGDLAEARGEDRVQQLTLELIRIKEQYLLMKRRFFASESEREPRPKAATPPKSLPPEGPREQRQLEVEDHLHTLPENKRLCPTCGKPMVAWKGQTEDSEEIDVVFRRFVLKKHRRQKYRCTCGAAPVTAPGPPKLPGGGRHSLDFAIEAAVAKTGYHLPWERQATMMRREGLDVDSNTLWEQNERLTRLLLATFLALRAYVASAPLLHIDETTWRLMQKNAKAYWVWVFGRHDAVVYAIEPSRGHEVALELLKGFEGVFVCDGWSAYKTLGRKLPRASRAACWAHARRGFKEVEHDRPECVEVRHLIGKLFLIERDLPHWENITDPALQRQALDHIREVRQRLSKPIVEAIQHWRRGQRELSRGAFGKALEYLDNQWYRLTLFLRDPRAPLTNNAAERAVKGPVLGRKNFGGCRSLRGLEVAGQLYSLIESAKLVRVDPRAYLRAAAEAALQGKPPLLPHAYKAQLRASAVSG